MANRIKYKKGDIIDKLIFIEEIQPKTTVSKSTGRQHKSRRIIAECPKCGKHFETSLVCARNHGTSGCGSCRKSRLTHGQTNNPLYDIWHAMVSRCHNKSNSQYKYYGAKGVSVCSEWRNDMFSFFDCVSKLDNYMRDGYSLDRINVEGNYEPNNVRFATQRTQIINRRKMKNNSGYTGVYFYKKKNKFQSTICVNYKKNNLGCYENVEDAVIARNNFIIENGLKEYKIQELIN